MTGAALYVHDLSVALGGRPVVRRVDMTVRQGEFVTVLGGNGSGKSTLVRAAMGLVPAISGHVELLGIPVHRFHDWHRVGYVPQRSSAASGVPATVREVVTSGRLAHRRVLRRLGRNDHAAIDAAVDAVDLSDRAGDSVAELSGGQQQRVLIARALAAEPDLLVLDEPTAGVDLPHQDLLTDVLSTHSARGVAIVMVGHELGPLVRLVDRAVVLRDGRVVFDGSPQDATVTVAPPDGLHHLHGDMSRGDPGDPGDVLGPSWSDGRPR